MDIAYIYTWRRVEVSIPDVDYLVSCILRSKTDFFPPLNFVEWPTSFEIQRFDLLVKEWRSVIRDGLTNTGELESDSGSDKANSPAGGIPSTSSCLPSPSTPVRSSSLQFPHISSTMNGTSSSPSGNHQSSFANRPRKSSVNGSSATSSGWYLRLLREKKF